MAERSFSSGCLIRTSRQIAAPEEQAEVAALRLSLPVETVWQSSLLDPAGLPFSGGGPGHPRVAALPRVFTAFRQEVERLGQRPAAPLAMPAEIPPLPPGVALLAANPGPEGGETAALAHLAQYFARGLAHSYKATRDALAGFDSSSRWSPWLSSGALSPRVAFAALRRFEEAQGANDGTYWLWFELLWRDYFRFLHLQEGARLYRAGGLTEAGAPTHDAAAFERWRLGETGAPLIDAGMHELASTGWLSNRMRQLVASFLIYDLGCDYRAGAAWFEAQLIDYDVYSNHGNWLYIAGRGTDPRGGRRFDLEKQARAHDPDGAYRARWKQ